LTRGDGQGLCPFHRKRLRATVSPERQIFHCFGCNKGGNVFQFVMEMDGVSFRKRCALGRRVGIEWKAVRAPRTLRRTGAVPGRRLRGALLPHRLTRSPAPKARLHSRAVDSRRLDPLRAWIRARRGIAVGGGAEVHPQNVLTRLRLVVPREAGRGSADYFRTGYLPDHSARKSGGRLRGRTLSERTRSTQLGESALFQKGGRSTDSTAPATPFAPAPRRHRRGLPT
jgi:hypothetical protein